MSLWCVCLQYVCPLGRLSLRTFVPQYVFSLGPLSHQEVCPFRTFVGVPYKVTCSDVIRGRGAVGIFSHTTGVGGFIWMISPLSTTRLGWCMYFTATFLISNVLWSFETYQKNYYHTFMSEILAEKNQQNSAIFSNKKISNQLCLTNFQCLENKNFNRKIHYNKFVLDCITDVTTHRIATQVKDFQYL